MSINPINAGIQQTALAQKPQGISPLKKNDGDGDEINGADPANEKARDAAKTSVSQNASGITLDLSNSSAPVGSKLNKTA